MAKEEELRKKKNHNHNNKTSVIATRLENDVYDVLERRAKKRGLKVAEHIRGFLTYDARRRR